MLRCLLAGLLLAPLAAGAAAEETENWVPPRTAAGHPDLGGVWDFRTLTPLERPRDLGERALLTEEEARGMEARAAARSERLARPTTGERGPEPSSSIGVPYNDFWMDQRAGVVEGRRTSLIIDPSDGHLPALRAGVEVQRAGEERPTVFPVRVKAAGIGTDGPESRGLAERCVMGFNEGPPLMPRGYNQNIRFVQTADRVVLLNEMIHDVRIIRLDSEHLPPDVRRWLGDSIGWWEGDTLVVETTNFRNETASYTPDAYTAFGSGLTLRLVERFRRVAEDLLLYEYTVDDPQTFSRPFTVALSLRPGEGGIFEYACHEGNYALRHMLEGARASESTGAAAVR